MSKDWSQICSQEQPGICLLRVNLVIFQEKRMKHQITALPNLAWKTVGIFSATCEQKMIYAKATQREGLLFQTLIS